MNDFAVPVKDHGRMNLPKSLRAALNLQEGDDLVFQLTSEGTAEVVSTITLARGSRGLFIHLKQQDSETDTFLAELHAEAEE